MAPDRDERYRQLTELSPDAILVHDGERIAYGNAAALRLAGATHQAQLVGQPVDHFLTPPFLKSVAVQLTGPVATELTPPVRDTFRRLDQSIVEVEVRSVAFIEDGRPAAHLVLRDITGRLAGERAVEQMTERLHQAERLEAIGGLAGGVAHEVNNMMAVVLGLASPLLQDATLPAASRPDILEIMKAAGRAATVTRQLLAFSRRQAHQPRAADLGLAVSNVMTKVRALLGPEHHLVVDAPGGPVARIDPAQFEELLLILAHNARDAMPAGGTLTVTVKTTTLPDLQHAADGLTIPAGRHATVAVQDTGTGMNAGVRARLFQPFFTTKPAGTGPGLGLAAAQGILAQHDGHITVMSTPGAGSTFTLHLPILLDEAPAIQPEGLHPAARAEGLAGTTVLVVDDEPAVREVTARSLERGGYRVLQASDGVEALAMICRDGPPELILTDLTMPGIGGVELARRLKLRWPALPILYMSGYPAEELRRQGGSAMARDLIEKPFSPGELTERVGAALARALAAPGRA